jgi:hypothetical protein
MGKTLMGTTHGDWIWFNLGEREFDKVVDFKVGMMLKSCQHLSFHDAVDYTANLIPGPRYVALSGGADSEFVCRAFHRNKIDFTPIIVYTKANNIEIENAIKLCEELKIEPIILRVDPDEFLYEFITQIYRPLNGVGIWSTPVVIAAKYIKDKEGYLITGDHHMDVHNYSNVGVIDCDEWEFYGGVLYPRKTINFFDYTIEMMRALASYTQAGFNDEYKCRIYGVKERKTTGYFFTPELNELAIGLSRRLTPKYKHIIMTKHEFLDRT